MCHAGSVVPCILSVCLSQLSQACWGHVERAWLGVRSHGDSTCRYIGLPGEQLAGRLFGGPSVGCSFSLGTSDRTCNHPGSCGAEGCYSMNAGAALKDCGWEWGMRSRWDIRHIFLPGVGQKASSSQPKLYVFTLGSHLPPEGKDPLQRGHCIWGMHCIQWRKIQGQQAFRKSESLFSK